jgi:hypothetical protein
MTRSLDSESEARASRDQLHRLDSELAAPGLERPNLNVAVVYGTVSGLMELRLPVRTSTGRTGS